MRLTSIILLSAATLCACTQEAIAARAIATFTGKFSSGTDPAGQFGSAGSDLSGRNFLLSMFYDTSSVNGFTSYPNYQSTQTITGALIIVGGKLTTPPLYSGAPTFVSTYNEPTGTLSSGLLYQAMNYQITTYIITKNGASLTKNSTLSPSDMLLGSFSILSRSATTGMYATVASGSLSSASISVQTSAVPEPAAWAMLIAGVGATGAALRRRRKQEKLNLA